MPWVLLVEGNSLKRDLISRRLQAQGMNVLVAVDGGQALDVARRESPDLVVLDTDLPDVDGWDAVRALKEDDATHAIPVVAIAGDASGNAPGAGLRSLVEECETKPIEMSRLVGKIQALLERQPARPV
jgi:two-component system cell cycle response regulator DivK